MKALRLAAWTLLALLLLAAAGATIAALTFDTAAAVARVAAQVRRATGRDLTLAAPPRLRWSWPPELVATGLALSNPPGNAAGTSRPALLTVAELRARVALLPLLFGRAELDVLLLRPDVQIEGSNWRLTPEPPPPATGPAAPSRTPWLRTTLHRLRLEDARLTLRDGPFPGTFAVPDATLTLDDAGALSAHARATAPDGAPLSLRATAAPGLYPLHLALNGPLRLGDATLATLTADAPAPGQPGHLRAAASLRGTPVALDLAVTPDALAVPGPLPFTLAAATAGATLTAQGTLAPPSPAASPDARPLDATVSLRIPDFPALSPLANRPLPALGAVSLDARVLAPAGLRAGLALRSLRLAAAPGNLAGDVALAWTSTPALRGTLTSSRLDADALLAALRPPAPPPAAASPSPAPAPPGPAVSAPPPVSAPPAPARLIPDLPLPLPPPGAPELDLVAALTSVTLLRQPVPGLDLHLTAAGGRLRLDPLVATLPAGRLAGTLAADAATSPPSWSLDLHGAALRLDRLTDAVHGTADLDLSLAATGATTRALAATLDGRASLALLSGDINNHLLATLLEAPLRTAHVALDLSGRTPLRCLLLPVTATAGMLSTPGLLLDTARLRLDGEGTADLRTETLALQLRPALAVGGGLTAEVPVRVSGPFAHPAVALDANGRVALRLAPRRSDPDACGPQPPEPAAPTRPDASRPDASRPDASRPDASRPGDLLRGLFR